MQHLCERRDDLPPLYRSSWLSSKKLLSFFDNIRFGRFLSESGLSLSRRINVKNSKYVSSLVSDRFGKLHINTNYIFSLSDHFLSESESLVLSRGLDFCVPPLRIDREIILSQCEILFFQLVRNVPVSEENFDITKSRLFKFAHSYCKSSIDSNDFPWKAAHFQTISALKKTTTFIAVNLIKVLESFY